MELVTDLSTDVISSVLVSSRMTMVFAGQFAIEQNGVPADRIAFHRYAAGHSAFEDPDALAALSADLHRFVGEVAGR